MTRPGRISLAAVALASVLVTGLEAQTMKADQPALTALSGFGTAIAIGDGELIVADPLSRKGPGTIYIYRKGSDGSWEEAYTLKASDAAAGDTFGRAVATDGTTLLVGATAIADGAGAAFVYQRDGTGTWQRQGGLTPSGVAPGDQFGRQVALSGDFAFVSASGHNEGAGAVFVFRRDGDGKWSEQAMLAGNDLAANDQFGWSLSADGNRVAVGAPSFRNTRIGAAYIFDFDAASGSWTQSAKIEGRAMQAGAGFGSSILLNGDHLIAGAPGSNNFQGSAVIFSRDSETGEWSEAMTLTPFDGSRRAGFGGSFAMAGNELWIGSPGAERRNGVVYRFMVNHDAGTMDGVVKLRGADLKRGDSFGGTIAVRDDIAVIGMGGADFGEGKAKVFERDAAGNWNETATLLSKPINYAAVTGGRVNCAGGEASVFKCDQVDLISFLPVSEIGGARGVRVNDLWGWTDPETGREYALVGRLDGTSFIDVTDAANPKYLGNLPMTEGANASTWRDIKVYKNHAFIVADGAGEHGMQVFDLTQLRDLRNAPRTFTETAHYDRINSAHNIVINEETGYAFSVGNSGGGETCGGGLHMINIQDPEHPTFAGCFSDTETGRRRTGYTHDAQCVTYHGPDEKYRGREICFGANETALSVADVTDKNAPVKLAAAPYPNVGYTHQGWLTEDQKYFFLDDELDELRGFTDHTRTMIWDVSDLDDPVLVKEYFGPTEAIDHNLYIKGNLMYQSNYLSGLRIVDISDVENPHEIGYFDTVPYGENSASFGGSWSNYPFFKSGVIVVTSGTEGVFVLKKKEIIP